MTVKTIYVEITNTCNLNCTTCYNRSGRTKQVLELSKIQLQQIIQTFAPFGLSRVLLSGGEPALHSEFDSILDLVDQYPTLSFGIVTNATVHKQKLLEFLNTRPNFTVQISLDGSDEEHNSKTRGKGNFQKAFDFASKIHNPAAHPLLKMVISQSNLQDIESFYRLARSIGFTPEFAFIFKSGNGSSAWEQKAVAPQQKLKAFHLIEALNHQYGCNALPPAPTLRCPFTQGAEELSLCIKTDGCIQPCQMLYEAQFTLGNVFSFNVAGFQARLDDIVRLAQARYASDYGCSKCVLNGHCGKGCMGAAANLHHHPLADDGDCAFRKLQLLSRSMRQK